ncbi:sulfatase-like hydrolase/transferase [Paenibacillus alba]|uniref:Sulfatase-like hydrolase/transferase n=1 Tax=Paenibacillus alba TaxID=1197127 RepID=A0ABU6G0L7_9BACL|nr:sulfatase-like hydrolase/transferase [Paenibacillus alba]
MFTVFAKAYCASLVCTPARASIFTGRYPHVHGAWNISVSLREDERRDVRRISICRLPDKAIKLINLYSANPVRIMKSRHGYRECGGIPTAFAQRSS